MMSKKHKRLAKEDIDIDQNEEKNKPLKLVLKVGGHTPAASPSPASIPSTVEEISERKRRHKKKRKKEKRRRKDRDDEDDDVDSEIEEATSPQPSADAESKLSEMDIDDGPPPPAVSSSRSSRHSNDSEAGPQRHLRERKQGEEQSALQQLLMYLQRILQRKDINGFFAYPVTDQIAPKYSEIIKCPMDFSTIKDKIENNSYTSVIEYRSDFRVMMQNCMTYNHPDTIFYKEAEKLLSFGLKQLNKDRLLSLKRSLPFMADISDSELGLDVEDNITIVEYKKSKTDLSQLEIVGDDLSTEDLLNQVRQAAKEAADKVAHNRPGRKMGYLRAKPDGSTTFNFLNPDNDGFVSETERVINFEQLIGKLKGGPSSLSSYREDKRNKATPVTYLTYGPFSSFAPVYDSSAANMTKEDSDLLLETYGGELGMKYADSIQHFVENAGDYTINLVDNLLDLLTQNEHSRTMNIFKERLKETEEQAELLNKSANTQTFSTTTIDESSLSEGLNTASTMASDLDSSAQLIQNLAMAQHERLSAPLPTSIKDLLTPSPQEEELAEQIHHQLLNLAQQVRPRDLVSREALHKSMGIEDTKYTLTYSPQALPGHKGLQESHPDPQSPTPYIKQEADFPLDNLYDSLLEVKQERIESGGDGSDSVASSESQAAVKVKEEGSMVTVNSGDAYSLEAEAAVAYIL